MPTVGEFEVVALLGEDGPVVVDVLDLDRDLGLRRLPLLVRDDDLQGMAVPHVEGAGE